MVDSVAEAHPRINLILDPEKIRWADQESAHSRLSNVLPYSERYEIVSMTIRFI